MNWKWLAGMTVATVAASAIAACNGTEAGLPGAPATHGAAAASHPDTAPSPTPTPIQLAMGAIIGTPYWPDFDTPSGGQGSPVDGITCRKELFNQWHHHVQLTIFYNGTQIAVPEGVGILGVPGKDPKFIYHGSCFYWLHTHDKSGIIHIEPSNSNTFGLKQFFDIWGEPLSATQVADLNVSSIGVYLNGQYQPGMDPSTIMFYPFEQITLVVNSPAPNWIPSYLFPPGYP